jgi:hypothetical protein
VLTVDLRPALRSPARLLIIALEQRGVTLRLRDGRIAAAPRHLLTDADRFAIRQHADHVRVLVAHRAAWSAWPQPVPAFDPRRAFLAAGAGQKAG